MKRCSRGSPPNCAPPCEPAGNPFLTAGCFSLFISLLLLVPALYMLQMYDRVLTSRSESTLLLLTLLVVGLMLTLGALDWVRSQILDPGRGAAGHGAESRGRLPRCSTSNPRRPEQRERAADPGPRPSCASSSPAPALGLVRRALAASLSAGAVSVPSAVRLHGPRRRT
ncbi:MAG: hypothetical protein M0C28_06700 [Candidatus Moduliflexus flocculans]|nr:hypothetical protein [Candidatus Moduliflexus flocculans]